MRVFQLVLCKSLTLFQTNTCHFPNSFLDLVSKIHTRFQALQVNRFGNPLPCPRAVNILFHHFVLSYIIVFDTEHVAGKNTRFRRSCGSFENNAGFQTIIMGAKSIPVFRPKRHKRHSFGVQLYQKGVSSPTLQPPDKTYQRQFLYLP